MALFSKTDTTNYPSFWQEYLDGFESQKAKAGFLGNVLDATPLNQTRFVIFDCETTGLDYKEDRILSIGAVTTIDNKLSITDGFELFVQQDLYRPESATIHGILKEGTFTKVTEEEAIAQFIKFIGTDILVGHHVGFDVAVVNTALKRLDLGSLKNRSLDTEILYKRLVHPVNKTLQERRYSLDQLAEALKIPLHDRHTSAGDAFITALAFIKIVHRLNSDNSLRVKDLFRR